MTFSSLREYEPGDDPRRIHWRSTARTGTLMVRELIDTTEPTTTIVLDTRTAAMTPGAFEHAVEVAASVAHAAVLAGRPARLLIPGEDAARLAEDGAVSMLDRLAAAGQGTDDLAALLYTVERAPAGGALVVVTGAREPALPAKLGEQRRRFSPVVVATVLAETDAPCPRTPPSRYGRPRGAVRRRGRGRVGPHGARGGGMNTWSYAVARLALATGTAALAGLSFASVFGGSGAAFLLAVLVPPAAVLCWAVWARTTVRPDGDRARVPAPAAAAGLLAVLVAAGLTTMPGADVASGPYRLLTGALPADPSGPQLATVSAFTGFAALVCCLLVLTERAAIATVLPAVACLLAGSDSARRPPRCPAGTCPPS